MKLSQSIIEKMSWRNEKALASNAAN